MVLNQLINSATIGCTIFLAVLTGSKKSNTPLGYWFLSLLFILISIIFADELLDNLGIYNRQPILLMIFQPFLYAFAPLIYLAISHLTSPGKKVSPKILYHFIPYLILLGLYILTYLSNDASGISTKEEMNQDKLLEIFLLLIFFLQISLYLYFSIKKLARHSLTLPLFVSSIADNNYHWLYKTIIGLSILLMISFVEVVFDQMHVSFYFSFFYLIGFYYIGIQVTKQKNVFPFSKDQMESVVHLINDHNSVNKTIVNENELTTTLNNDPNVIERKKVISEEKMAYYKEQLLGLMEREKPYLDSEITLPKLGKLLLLNTYQTSYLINNCFGENFYTFINRYRLEECKRMLASEAYSHLSILGIAFESGFNSKTAFNTSFKKYTGLSPKEFKEQMDQTASSK